MTGTKTTETTPETSTEKKAYTVTHAHRVGALQIWHKPDDVVHLLDCEAHFALGRGWLRPAGEPEPEKLVLDKPVPEEPETAYQIFDDEPEDNKGN